MGGIDETGDEWVVEPEPITFPEKAPAEPVPAHEPVPAGTSGGVA